VHGSRASEQLLVTARCPRSARRTGLVDAPLQRNTTGAPRSPANPTSHLARRRHPGSGAPARTTPTLPSPPTPRMLLPCTGRSAKPSRTARTNPAPPTSTTASARCAATTAPAPRKASADRYGATGCSPDSGPVGDGVAACRRQRADLTDRAGDGRAVHRGERRQRSVRQPQPQVHQRDQEPVHEHRAPLGSCPGGPPSVPATPLAQHRFPPCLLFGGEFFEQLAEVRAGDAAQGRVSAGRTGAGQLHNSPNQ
jgi:hypothetical protein